MCFVSVSSIFGILDGMVSFAWQRWSFGANLAAWPAGSHWQYVLAFNLYEELPFKAYHIIVAVVDKEISVERLIPRPFTYCGELRQA